MNTHIVSHTREGSMNTQLLGMGMALLAIAVMGLSFGEASASDRAGTARFPAGQAGIFVNLNPAMPDDNYTVTVQQTNTAGYSPISLCTYFNVLKKTASQFEVQHKRCDNGQPVNLDVGVSLDWQVSERTAVLGQSCGSVSGCTYHQHCGIPGNPLVCVDDSISANQCNSDSACPTGQPICVGTPACSSLRFCYQPCP